jgi:membrane protease YdiL (CAAX protease family)
MKSTKETFHLARPGVALSLFGCIFLFLLIVAGVILPFLPRFISKPEAVIRISVVLQDLIIFILPAIATAMVVTRLPAQLLCIDRKPRLSVVLITMAVMICATPALNAVIEWNSNWHLPDSMANVEQFFRQLEDGAEATTKLLMSGASIPSLIISILIVGILAGFSEELFFRGAFQRIMSQMNLNIHVVIWSVAFIFSAFHLQLFGFVPRMLLGAFLGYLLYWSKSLWVPIIAHSFNNTLVVISEYIKTNSSTPSNDAVSLSDLGSSLASPYDIIIVIASLVLTVIGIIYLRNHTLRHTV